MFGQLWTAFFQTRCRWTLQPSVSFSLIADQADLTSKTLLQSVYMCVCMSVCLSLFLSLCLSASVYLSVCMSVCLCLSVCVCVCLSLFLSLSVIPFLFLTHPFFLSELMNMFLMLHFRSNCCIIKASGGWLLWSWKRWSLIYSFP